MKENEFNVALINLTQDIGPYLMIFFLISTFTFLLHRVILYF